MSALEIEQPIGPDTDWRASAACHGRIELFFGKVAERPQARERREAKARKLCDSCIVRQPCRQFAREHREYGFWGGESEEDRYVAGYPLSGAIGVKVRLARQAAAATT
jgi:WhiB family redox-sensing transcriptional regulator